MTVLLWIVGVSLYLFVGVVVVRFVDTRFPGDLDDDPPLGTAAAVAVWPLVAFLFALMMLAYFLDALVRRGR